MAEWRASALPYALIEDFTVSTTRSVLLHGANDIETFVIECEAVNSDMNIMLGVHVLGRPLWPVLKEFSEELPDWERFLFGEFHQNVDNIQMILSSHIRRPGRIFMQLHGWVIETNSELLIHQGFRRVENPAGHIGQVEGFEKIPLAILKALDDGHHTFYHRLNEHGYVTTVMANRSPLMYQIVVNTAVYAEDNVHIKEHVELLRK